METTNRYESVEDALMFCIRASNKEVKQVAAALWPSDRIETAYPRLIEGLNPAKRMKLTMDEIIFIMNYCGRYDALYYMADRCLHERPNKLSVELEQKQVAEQFHSMMEQATKAYQHIMSLSERRDEIEKIQKGVVSFMDVERKMS
jgi:hypothetical protein